MCSCAGLSLTVCMLVKWWWNAFVGAHTVWCVGVFLCLASSKKAVPSLASAAERHADLLCACLEDPNVPLMVWSIGLVFKACTGLLKSASSPIASFSVTESVGEIQLDGELRASLNTQLYSAFASVSCGWRRSLTWVQGQVCALFKHCQTPTALAMKMLHRVSVKPLLVFSVSKWLFWHPC